MTGSICNDIKILLLDYANNKLSEKERLLVQSHISNCIECKKLLEEEIDISKMLSDVTDPLPENDVWNKIQENISYNPSSLSSLRNIINKSYAKMFAAVTAVAVVLFVFNSSYKISNNSDKYDKNKQTEIVKWSDDPIAEYTEAFFETIEDL
ncbi:MAG: zf-HC2 domain-containing protein [Armatimonadota bacterium]